METKTMEEYKASIDTYNEKYDTDEDFRMLADKSPEQALSEVGITDPRAFINAIQQSQEDLSQLSDEDTSTIHGGSFAGAAANVATLSVLTGSELISGAFSDALAAGYISALSNG